MSHTAYDEAWGGSLELSMSADEQLRLPYGNGGCRFYILRPLGGGLSVVLPDATLCQTGAAIITLCNDEPDSVDVYTGQYQALVTTLAPGTAVRLYLSDNSTSSGNWGAVTTAFELGSPMVADRRECSIVINQSDGSGTNLRDLARALGFVDEVAYSVNVALANDVVLGNEVTTSPGLDTGEWPVGTTMLLFLSGGARICGKGGAGGKGGNGGGSATAFPGSVGGPALVTRLDVSVVNYGYIQGGGGGGGGGIGSAAPASVPGGGGGGGAGYLPSLGGLSGIYTSGPLNGQRHPGGNGGPGSVGVAGNGGGTPAANGGNGGAPGAAGSAALGVGSQAGGAAGAAVRKLTGTVVTWVRTGTVNGAEVFF